MVEPPTWSSPEDEQVQPVVGEGVRQGRALGDRVGEQALVHGRPDVEGQRPGPCRTRDVDLGDLDLDPVDGRGGVGRGPSRAQGPQPDRRVTQGQGGHPAHRDPVVPREDEDPDGGRRGSVGGAPHAGPPHRVPLQVPERPRGQEQVLDRLPGLLLGGPPGGPDVGGQGLQVCQGGHGQSVPRAGAPVRTAPGCGARWLSVMSGGVASRRLLARGGALRRDGSQEDTVRRTPVTVTAAALLAAVVLVGCSPDENTGGSNVGPDIDDPAVTEPGSDGGGTGEPDDMSTMDTGTDDGTDDGSDDTATEGDVTDDGSETDG